MCICFGVTESFVDEICLVEPLSPRGLCGQAAISDTLKIKFGVNGKNTRCPKKIVPRLYVHCGGAVDANITTMSK